jgi:hypothetical protein
VNKKTHISTEKYSENKQDYLHIHIITEGKLYLVKRKTKAVQQKAKVVLKGQKIQDRDTEKTKVGQKLKTQVSGIVIEVQKIQVEYYC